MMHSFRQLTEIRQLCHEYTSAYVNTTTSKEMERIIGALHEATAPQETELPPLGVAVSDSLATSDKVG